MSLWVLIPVKPFREGKSRLASVLNPQERERLNRWLLRHVLRTVQEVPQVFRVMVISRDPAVLRAAREWGAHTLQESGATGLNETLTRATLVLEKRGLRRALVLPADLPRLTPEDVQEVIHGLYRHPYAGQMPFMVIAPDRYHSGTNALLLDPVQDHEFAFGPGSFIKHIARARQQGRFVVVVERPGLAYDLDAPEDLTLVAHAFPHWQARLVSGYGENRDGPLAK